MLLCRILNWNRSVPPLMGCWAEQAPAFRGLQSNDQRSDLHHSIEGRRPGSRSEGNPGGGAFRPAGNPGVVATGNG